MKSIIKQSSFLIFAHFLARGIGFFYTIFLARNLGVADFGLLTSALVYFSLISAISDFGFNRYLIKESSINLTKTSELVWNISMLRLVISSILFAFISLVLYLLDPDKFRVGLTLLAILAIYPLAVSQTIDGIFVAKRKLQFSATAIIIWSISNASIGIYLINSGYGVIGAANALVWGHIIYLILLMLLLWREKTPVLSHINLHTFKKIASESLPFGVISIIGLLYFRIDALVLAYLKGNFEAGIYGAAYRFLEVIIYIPSSVSASIFPILVRMHGQENIRLRSVFEKTIWMMGSLGIAITVLLQLILPQFIMGLMPQYSLSIDVVKVLSLSIPLLFIYLPLSQIVLSNNRYLRRMIVISLVPLLFNISSNLIFIPEYGYMAAAWITVFSDILSTVVLIVFIRISILKDAKIN